MKLYALYAQLACACLFGCAAQPPATSPVEPKVPAPAPHASAAPASAPAAAKIITGEFGSTGTASAVNKPAESRKVLPARVGKAPICVLKGKPAIEHTVLKELKVGRNYYASIQGVIPELLLQAERAGADAIINYIGEQRYGFWPWRVVRPVIEGTAVKWNTSGTVDCQALGGTTH